MASFAIGLTATGLTGCLALMHNQLKHWDNSVALMTYALAHTPNSATSQATMGAAFAKAGKSQEAMAHYRESRIISTPWPRLTRPPASTRTPSPQAKKPSASRRDSPGLSC